MSLRRKKTPSGKRGSVEKASPTPTVERRSEIDELLWQYSRFYPNTTLEGRNVIRHDLERRITASRVLSENPGLSEVQRAEAKLDAVKLQEFLSRLPPAAEVPKKVEGPRREGLSKSSAADLQKREELTRLMMRPLLEEEEEKPPPTLKAKIWKEPPKDVESFVGREHLLVGIWPIDKSAQLSKFRKAYRQYKETGYEVGVAQYQGKAYLYARPTKRSGKTSEFIRTKLPIRESFAKTKTFKIPFTRAEGIYNRVGFFDNIGQLELAQNDLRVKGFSTRFFRYSKGRKGTKSEIGYVLYARHIKEPTRIPVIGGGEAGTASTRQYKEVLGTFAKYKGIEVGDKMDRWEGLSKITLYRHMNLNNSYSKVAKEQDKLRREGYFVVLKNYTSDTGVEYYTLFRSEEPSKERAKDYLETVKKREEKQRAEEEREAKREAKLSPEMKEKLREHERRALARVKHEAPLWPKKPTVEYVAPSKPHPKAVLVYAANATELDDQRRLIAKQKALNQKGIQTEVVIGTQWTNLYAVPSEGQEEVVLPKSPKRRGRGKLLGQHKVTEEQWQKTEQAHKAKAQRHLLLEAEEAQRQEAAREQREEKRRKAAKEHPERTVVQTPVTEPVTPVRRTAKLRLQSLPKMTEWQKRHMKK